MFCSNTLLAEYRAYQYLVRNRTSSTFTKANATQVTSSLDPVTYYAYHGGGIAIEIELLRTWICSGNTSIRKPVCPSPYHAILREEELKLKEEADKLKKKK